MVWPQVTTSRVEVSCGNATPLPLNILGANAQLPRAQCFESNRSKLLGAGRRGQLTARTSAVPEGSVTVDGFVRPDRLWGEQRGSCADTNTVADRRPNHSTNTGADTETDTDTKPDTKPDARTNNCANSPADASTYATTVGQRHQC